MASQNMDPAAPAASSTAALKGNESGGSAARGSVSKRWVTAHHWSAENHFLENLTSSVSTLRFVLDAYLCERNVKYVCSLFEVWYFRD